ncbi:hypothetical protein LSH36_908g00014, partial [Paralvinella palmiformis]
MLPKCESSITDPEHHQILTSEIGDVDLRDFDEAVFEGDSAAFLSADPPAFTGPLTSLRAVTSLPLSYPGIISLSKDCTTSLSTVSDIRQAQVTSRKGHFFW